MTDFLLKQICENNKETIQIPDDFGTIYKQCDEPLLITNISTCVFDNYNTLSFFLNISSIYYYKSRFVMLLNYEFYHLMFIQSLDEGHFDINITIGIKWYCYHGSSRCKKLLVILDIYVLIEYIKRGLATIKGQLVLVLVNLK